MANWEKLYNLTDNSGKKLGEQLTYKGNPLTSEQFRKGYFTGTANVNACFIKINEKREEISDTTTVWHKVLERDLTAFFKAYACDLPWAVGNSYCAGSAGQGFSKSDIEPLIGYYKSDKETDGDFRIVNATSYDDRDAIFKLGVVSYNFSQINGVLENPKINGQNLIFDLSIDITSPTIQNALNRLFPDKDFSRFKPQIVFSGNRQSFSYDIVGHTGTAIKTEEKNVDKKKSKTTKTDNKKTDTKVEKPYKPHVTTLQSKTTDYNDVGDGIFRKDYPFEVGDRNRLIGDINEKIYDSRRKDVYTQELLVDLKNIGAFGEDNYENVINKDVYDYVMKLMTPKDVIKESVKKVLKEYINSKK